MKKFGLSNGIIRTNQGGVLAPSNDFRTAMVKEFGYVVEPTGADSPSQNGSVEIYNNTLAVKVRTLLYGSGLLAKFWSAALLHAIYLHNPLVHLATGMTQFEGWYNCKPNIAYLKTFGSRVCVKQSGMRQCKLDRHNFTGIFLGYTATNQNIIYLDTMLGIVKLCHHAIFDEAWYLQPTCPPAAQLLYDLGLEAESDFISLEGPLIYTPENTITPITVPWPPTHDTTSKKDWTPPPLCLYAPLPLRMTESPTQLTARAARTRIEMTPLSNKDLTSMTVTDYFIRPHDMELIYLSPDPYGRVFEETLDLRKWDLDKHCAGGLRFITKNGCLILALMEHSTPGAQINKWQTRIHGTWLQSINDTTVSSLADVHKAFELLSLSHAKSCTLTFSHPEISPDISQHGLPIISCDDYFLQFTHDQLNNRINLIERGLLVRQSRKYDIVESGDVRQYTMRVMRLTRGCLLKQDDWIDWQRSEYLQLNQYADHKCFGDPTSVDKEDAVFHLVWTYNIKALDGRKKARCIYDGSSCFGLVKILDKVYANCINQTSSRLFYAISATKNLLIFGSDVCNAFAKAPPPKQGFYICPDRVFKEWWENHLK
jgi:hypothetical protein